MLNKTLIIISRTITSEEATFLVGRNILAISLVSMASLSAHEIEFRVIEDFLGRKNVEQKTKKFCQKISDWLSGQDKKAKSTFGVQGAYTLNGHWFMHRLKDLHYIHLLCDRIERSFPNQELWFSSDDKLPELEVSFESLNLNMFGGGLGHLEALMLYGLPNGITKPAEAAVSGRAQNSLFLQLIWRSPTILLRRSCKLLSLWANKFKKREKKFWVVQRGYDLEVLISKTHDVEFVDVAYPYFKPPSKISNSVNVDTGIFHDLLPRFAVPIEKIMIKYDRNIVSNLLALKKDVVDTLRLEKPDGLLYAMGSADVYQGIIAQSANEERVPVFYFKHGGIENLFLKKSQLDDYFELETVIKRVQFLHCPAEQTLYEGLKNVTPIVTGALDGLTLKNKKYDPRKKRMLYVAGPPACWSFRDPHKSTLDSERYEFARALFMLTEKLELSFDIKIHPADHITAFNFYESLRLMHPGLNCKLLIGGAVERIVHKYELVVFDMVSTRVLGGLIPTSKPFIVYVPFGLGLSEHFEALQRRAFVVRDKNSLEEFLRDFSLDSLDLKTDEHFYNKYTSISETGTPLGNIKAELGFNKIT